MLPVTARLISVLVLECFFFLQFSHVVWRDTGSFVEARPLFYRVCGGMM